MQHVSSARALASLLLALGVAASPAAAQSRVNELWRMREHDAVSLVSTFTRDAQGGHMRLEVARVPLGADAAAPPLTAAVTHAHRDAAARLVYEGDPVATTLVATPDGAAVIAWSATKVVVHLVNLGVPATDAAALRHVELPRGLGADSQPFAAVGCMKDGAVAVLWNEVGRGTGMAARSWLAHVALDGTVSLAAHEVQVPWSLAALTSVADGYELAVRYDGQGPGQTRLCLVHLAGETPNEHPWWASPPAMIGDVQLVAQGDAVRIAYATPGGVLLSAQRATGQWGQEAPASARLAAPSAFAVGLRSSGQPGIATP